MLKSPRRFFESVRAGILGPTLSEAEVSGCNAILEAMEGSPLAYTAYALATAFHETASTMQPIKEYGGAAYHFRMYDPQGSRPKLALANGNNCAGDGVKFAGRGYVQLTWRSNYKRAGDKLGVDLCATPDLAMRPDIAAKILRVGMQEGWFTGKKFSNYLPATGPGSREQFVSARRIINGTDRASTIAAHALQFQLALEAGEWA